MLTMLAVLAGVTAPVLTKPWITFRDYPQEAVRRGEQGAAEFRAVIAPDGKPENCEILSTAGKEDLARRTCPLFMRQARFHPAMDRDGNPTYGVIHSVNNFWLPDRGNGQFPLELGSDLRLAVKADAGTLTLPVTVTVHVAIDEKGAVQACSVPESEESTKLGSVACTQVSQSWQDLPIKNAQGAAVPYVKAVKVTFEEANR